MKKNVLLALVIIGLAALALVGFLLRRPSVNEKYQNTATNLETATTSPIHNPSDTIEVTSPAPNALVQPPLHIAGRARNPWYFEGQFPVELLDSAGTVLAKAPAQAGGDWTGGGFVPFSLTLNFPAPTTTAGLLIFKNDNPSGDPSKDIIFAIPLRFRQ